MADALGLFAVLLSGCGLFALITGYCTKTPDIKIAGNGFIILSQIITFTFADTNGKRALCIAIMIAFIIIDTIDRKQRNKKTEEGEK